MRGEAVTRVVEVFCDPPQPERVHVVGQRRQVGLFVGLGDGARGRSLVAVVGLVEVGLDGVEALVGALMLDHRLDDADSWRCVDVDEVLGIARQRVGAEVAGRLELGVVRGGDPFLGRRVVVAGRTDLDVADDVVIHGVQGRDRARRVIDAVDVVDDRVRGRTPAGQGVVGAHVGRTAEIQRTVEVPLPRKVAGRRRPPGLRGTGGVRRCNHNGGRYDHQPHDDHRHADER